MIGQCDGGLYDTRLANWSEKPIREKYAWSHSCIETAGEFKATLRAGEFTFPGGYQLALFTSDSGVLCFDCAKEEAVNVIWSIRNKVSDGWRVNGCFNVDNSEESMCCDHCAKVLNYGP